MRRFLPAASTASTEAPTTRLTCGPPIGARAAVTVRPTRCGARPAAVRRSVSPSGIGPRSAGAIAPSEGRAGPGPAAAGCRGGAARVAGTAGGSLAGATQDESAIAGDETGVDQAVPERRRSDRLAVDLGENQLAHAAVRHEDGER